MTEQEIEKKVNESIAWVEERVSLESYTKELIRLQFIHRIKQLRINAVVKSFYCFEESMNMQLKCDSECDYCKSIKIAQ